MYLVFLIDLTTLWQNSWCTTPLQWRKTVSKSSYLNEVEMFFSFLTLLCASIGMIELCFQCHSHTRMIHHLLSKSGSSLNVVNSSWAISMRRFFAQKFCNFSTIFTAIRFISKISTKIACYEHTDMLTSTATSLIVIRWVVKNYFLHCFNVFIGCWRTQAIRTCIVVDIFSAFLKPVILYMPNATLNISNVEHHHWHFLGFP